MLSDPKQLAVALLEAGPAIGLLPLCLAWSWQYLRRGLSFPGGLIPLTLAVVAAGLIFQYESVRETSRLPGTAIAVWTVFGLQPLSVFMRRGPYWARAALVVGLVAGMLGGVVLLSGELVAAARPTRAYFIDAEDSAIADRHWNRLAPQDEVFDSIAYRAVTIFGRPTYSYRTLWMPTGEYGRLLAEASPAQIAQAGFDYLYMDNGWWFRLSDAQRAGFVGGCATSIDEVVGSGGVFRKVYDLRPCAGAPASAP